MEDQINPTLQVIKETWLVSFLKQKALLMFLRDDDYPSSSPSQVLKSQKSNDAALKMELSTKLGMQSLVHYT